MNPEALRRDNGVLFGKREFLIVSIGYKNAPSKNQETPILQNDMQLLKDIPLLDPRRRNSSPGLGITQGYSQKLIIQDLTPLLTPLSAVDSPVAPVVIGYH